jgi:archaemetzincin
MLAIPATAYDARRGQYPGEQILATLTEVEALQAERILGVIDADCYAPALNFIFGRASKHGREAFIALPRLRASFYGLAENEALLRERMLKEAMHELGHTYGLEHCPDRRCVTHFSNSLHSTDVKGHRFCPRCRARLHHATGRLQADTSAMTCQELEAASTCASSSNGYNGRDGPPRV